MIVFRRGQVSPADSSAALGDGPAPWYVIPANHKWFMRAVVADVISARINALDLRIPSVSKQKRGELAKIRRALKT